jgi:hypothetical protein
MQVQGGFSEVFALLILAIAFLWIASAGSSRVLKVLDRRHFLLGGIRQQTIINNLQASGINIMGSGAVLSTTLRTSISGGTATPQRFSSSGGAVGGGGGSYQYGTAGAYGSTFTDNLICDNRFVFGFFAILLGVGRAAYLMSYLFVAGDSSSTGTGGNAISGDNLLADTVTAPLAWFFFSLLAAILWTLRDVLDRVKSTNNTNVPPLTDDRRPSNNLSGFNTHENSPSNQNQNNNINNYGTTTKRRSALDTIESDDSLQTAGDQVPQVVVANNDKTPPIKMKTTITTPRNIRMSNDSSEDELATPIQPLNRKSSINTNSETESLLLGGKKDNNNLNNKNGESATTTSSSTWFENIRPYRASLTIFFMFLFILVSLTVSWIFKEQKHDENSARLTPLVASSIISFVLMLWSIVSSIESLSVLRRIGIVAHRVAIAIIIMSIFLCVRGVLTLPPVQDQVCADNSSSVSFWSCSFLYNFIDCAGIALILQILP